MSHTASTLMDLAATQMGARLGMTVPLSAEIDGNMLVCTASASNIAATVSAPLAMVFELLAEGLNAETAPDKPKPAVKAKPAAKKPESESEPEPEPEPEPESESEPESEPKSVRPKAKPRRTFDILNADDDEDY